MYVNVLQHNGWPVEHTTTESTEPFALWLEKKRSYSHMFIWCICVVNSAVSVRKHTNTQATERRNRIGKRRVRKRACNIGLNSIISAEF